MLVDEAKIISFCIFVLVCRNEMLFYGIHGWKSVKKSGIYSIHTLFFIFLPINRV